MQFLITLSKISLILNQTFRIYSSLYPYHTPHHLSNAFSLIILKMAAIRRSLHQILQPSLTAKSLEQITSERELLNANRPALLQYIKDNVIGDFLPFPTAYGERALVYADYIASGRSLQFIEDYITSVVLPNYSNTHTSTSWVGLQTTYFRQEARSIIKRCLNASDET